MQLRRSRLDWRFNDIGPGSGERVVNSFHDMPSMPCIFIQLYIIYIMMTYDQHIWWSPTMIIQLGVWGTGAYKLGVWGTGVKCRRNGPNASKISWNRCPKSLPKLLYSIFKVIFQGLKTAYVFFKYVEIAVHGYCSWTRKSNMQYIYIYIWVINAMEEI